MDLNSTLNKTKIKITAFITLIKLTFMAIKMLLPKCGERLY
jgi:hypothetical protein